MIDLDESLYNITFFTGNAFSYRNKKYMMLKMSNL